MSSPFDARVHGGVDAREVSALGLDAREILDFSVNLNPYGPCLPVIEAVRGACLDVYPDASARAARNAWARTLDTSPERIAVGHGAADLFWAIARAFLAPGDEVAVFEPTFSEMRIAAQAAGANVRRFAAREESQWTLPLGELTQHAGIKLTYLCSPNNPTGESIPVDAICALAKAVPRTLLVLDQSFLSLSDHAAALHASWPDNVICVRSLTKDFCVPGLRIGLLVAARELVRQIEACRPTWATSAPALAAIEAAAGQLDFVADSWRRMRADRERITGLLHSTGCSVLPTSTGFQLLKVGDAARLRRALLEHGVLVRDASSFGLPGYVRIAARPEAEALELAAALKRVLPRGGFPACSERRA